MCSKFLQKTWNCFIISFSSTQYPTQRSSCQPHILSKWAINFTRFLKNKQHWSYPTIIELGNIKNHLMSFFFQPPITLSIHTAFRFKNTLVTPLTCFQSTGNKSIITSYQISSVFLTKIISRNVDGTWILPSTIRNLPTLVASKIICMQIFLHSLYSQIKNLHCSNSWTFTYRSKLRYQSPLYLQIFRLRDILSLS